MNPDGLQIISFIYQTNLASRASIAKRVLHMSPSFADVPEERSLYMNVGDSGCINLCSSVTEANFLRTLLINHPELTNDYISRLAPFEEGRKFLLESFTYSPQLAQRIPLSVLTDILSADPLLAQLQQTQTSNDIQFIIGVLQINTMLLGQLRAWIIQQFKERKPTLPSLEPALIKLTKSAEGLQLLKLLQINIPSMHPATEQQPEANSEEASPNKAPRLQP